LVIVAAVLFSIVTGAANVVAQPVPASRINKGDLLANKGDTYVVKDLFGRFIRIRVDEDTKLEPLVLLGMKIEATVLPDGTASQVEPLPVGSSTVTGEVLMITGAYYLTKDAEGRDMLDMKENVYVVEEETGDKVRVRVNEKTKIDVVGKVSLGDKIKATLSPEGYAVSIHDAQ
jgi:hypothetical protein